MARAAPSADLGLSITASLKGSSSCSLIGTWDVTPGAVFNPETPRVIAFDQHGRFASSATVGADLCSSALGEVGTWGISGADLSLVSVANLGGPCKQIGREAGFGAAFSADCDTVTLQLKTDSCTGSGIFYDKTVFHRRP